MDKTAQDLLISSRSRERAAFGALIIVQATLIFTIALITVPLPQIGREFDLTSAELLLALAAYGLPFSGLLLFGGRLADRYGGRHMFTVGLLIFGLASAIASLSPSFEVLVAMRFAQGVGGALTAPAAMAVLRSLFPEPAAFGRAMATWGGVSVLGAVMGFVVSGIATNWISWRWMFAVPLIVALIGLTSARSLLPAGASDRAARPALDPLGAILATVGISLTSLALIFTGDHAWSSNTVRFPLGLGLILLAIFVVVLSVTCAIRSCRRDS
ncbi:MFS transporter [Phytoactinopolyspora mesophila]|uniref:MFS transporter n=1 Tax=Phytoactinopolyspora mesophila TaxID=2650750 RepID=UPI001C9E5C50|nr:MFS transporter [Phytoactinopolyspora mesophila]